MAKKILGVSFGRKMSNCDIMVKHALMQCEKAGCEVQFIRADDLDVSNCTGCIACVIGMITGRGKGYCVRHDGFDILDEAVMQSDGLILACPTYETSVTGRFKTICDRIGPSHSARPPTRRGCPLASRRSSFPTPEPLRSAARR